WRSRTRSRAGGRAGWRSGCGAISKVPAVCSNHGGSLAWRPVVKVNLGSQLEAFVHRKVQSGLYKNQSDVVRKALRLLAEQDRLREAHHKQLRKTLADGLAQANRGVLLDGARVIRDARNSLRRPEQRKKRGR